MQWLMVGSSPSVLDTLPQVMLDLDNPTIITCNSGIKLCEPHHYVCVDQYASHYYVSYAKEAQKRGCNLITLKRVPEALKARNVAFYDEFLEVQGHGVPSRSQYGEFVYSGPLTLEYACHNGATDVHIVGCDGYRWNGDYFDPQTTRTERDVRELTKRTAMLFGEIAHAWHDVKFVQYGNPVFDILQPNWEVRKCVLS